MSDQLQPYRQSQPARHVVIHHVHHVRVTHSDDSVNVGLALKLSALAWAICAVILLVAALAA